MERIIRDERWEVKLVKALQDAETVKFEYGITDCTTWSAYVVSQYTNLKWQPTWTNKKEALKQQKSKPMEQQVSKVLKQGPKTIFTKIKRGDLVQKGVGIDAALGIYVGQGKVAFIAKVGLVYIRVTECTYYWEI